MIFYNLNNITIGQFDDLLLDNNYVKRIVWFPVPKKIVRKKAAKIISDFNKNRNKDHQSKIYKAFDKLSVANKLSNVYPAIYQGFMACYKLTALTGKAPEVMAEFEQMFRDVFLMEPTPEAVQSIPKKMEKLEGIIEDEEKPEQFDFSEYLIIYLEPILTPLTIRDKKLVHLHKYEELAVKKIKAKKEE